MTRLVGVFSGLDPAGGGIAVAGRAAWSGVIGRTQADLISYGPIGPREELPLPGRVIEGQSKLALAGQLLTRRWAADACIVWHLGLLKLLPMLRGFRGKVVAFLHGIEAWRPQDRLVRYQLGRVDEFLSNSDHTWERFLSFCPGMADHPHRTVHLGWGAPLGGPTPVPADRPSAVIVSRLAKGEDYKGHRELIRAWPQLRRLIPDACLDVVGDGDLRPELERFVGELGLQAAIRFHGRVSEARKTELITEARCMVMPSRGEGFGLVYVEAMRLGRPCLASDCDAGREVLHPPDGGLTAPPADADALVTAVAQLMADGAAWGRRSEAARRRYEQTFTERHFHDRLRAALTAV